MYSTVKMGKLIKAFNDGRYQDITLCVTEECNLRCKYCYMVHKNNFKRLSFDTAKKAVDDVLSMEPAFDAVVWNFIGGEPTLEMKLIDQITDYIKLKMFELNHQWLYNHAFFIGTNGLLYESDAVQRYLRKNKGTALVGITIDGNKDKHDLQRVYPDGNGSYDDVLRNVKLWIAQQTGSVMTKATYSSDDLKYLKDSVISLWDLGIDYIAANVVFEDVWKTDDPMIYENQLRELADYVIENELWDKYSVRFFSPDVGYQMDPSTMSRAFCGSGKMLAVSCEGLYYPCIRFTDFCMNGDSDGLSVGCVGCGVNDELLKPFKELSIGVSLTEKCRKCKIAQGCPTCTGLNYDELSGMSIYQRTIHHCEMQKAQVRANKYFWMKYSTTTKKVSPYQHNRFKQFSDNGWKLDNLEFLYILTADNCIPYCDYTPSGNKTMTNELFIKAVEYTVDNDMVPVVLTENPNELPEIIDYIAHIIIFPMECGYKKKSSVEFAIPIYTAKISNTKIFLDQADTCILNISETNIKELPGYVYNLSKGYRRININKLNALKWDAYSIKEYEEALVEIKRLIDLKSVSLNIMTSDQYKYCEAGANSYAVCPDGNLYACPAYYYSENGKKIGDITSGISSRFAEVFSNSKRQYCIACDKRHCSQCSFHSLIDTGNVSTPSECQCEIAQLEYDVLHNDLQTCAI